ncbi:MAG: hypothetical protein GY798_09155 [Hyphomicrobiales bacterium]|nr:hypothetical protein [Hyphomicrobiales bacterium]
MLFRKPVWVHEDDLGTVQVLPMACWNDCVDQLGSIEEFAERHEAPDGLGWTKMYEIQPGPKSLEDLSIKVGKVKGMVPLVMRPARKAVTGTYSGPDEPLERTAAYRAGGNAVLVSWSEDHRWTWLSFSAGHMTPWQLGPLSIFFHRLSSLAAVLLVDWRGALIDLSDHKAIVRYLKDS